MKGWLDLDGVIANCTDGICKRFGTSSSDLLSIEDSHRKRYEDEFGDENIKEVFRDHIFWVDLEKYWWSDLLVDLYVELFGDNWKFLTKASEKSPGSYYGKALWVTRHYPEHFDKLWVCRGDKFKACSGPDSFLLDDHKKNIENWNSCGGKSFTWLEIGNLASAEIIEERIEKIRTAVTTYQINEIYRRT